MTIIIYQILDNTTGRSYIGSTSSPLRTRLSIHLSCYNKWINTNYNSTYYSSFEVFKNEDFTVYILELLGDYEVEERYLRERHYIDTIGNCVNKCVPSRTLKQYYNDHSSEIKQSMKDYYKNHKEQCSKAILERYTKNINGYRDKQIQRQVERYNYKKIQELIETELDS